MSAIESYRKAGPRHESFAMLVGDWSMSMTVWDTEGTIVAQTTDMSASKRLVHEGRYVREDVIGRFETGPHEKTTMLGFNNIRNRYEYMTADNYDAVILLYTSAPGADLDDRRIEVFADYVYAGDEPKPSGTLVTIRTIIEVESQDRHVLTNYYNAPGAPEYRFLRYEYKRRS
ncbi:MAG: DUF1579 family protein [Pseudomonadota bacterium]